MSTAFRSRIVHALSTEPLELEYIEDGVLLVEDGLVQDLGPAKKFEQAGFPMAVCQHYPDHLLVPGFIDTHVHSPQLDVIGSYSGQLLDWLNTYTFPAESKYADETYAATAAVEFLNNMLLAGTTSALVFVTSHLQATDALFEAAEEKNLRLIAGKVLMDQNSIPTLEDTAIGGIEDSETLDQRWHGRSRLGYAITPRFAGTSTAEQLQLAGELHQKYPDTWIQTHLSENLKEIEWTAEVHPEATDYLNIYERHGLVNDRTMFAHCLHLSDSELSRLNDAGGQIAFCPASNLFLGSGLFDMERMRETRAVVSLASDVGGGTSLNMLRIMSDAYKVCQMKGYRLSAREAFAMVTLGNATALQIDSYVGNFLRGKEADFLLLSTAQNEILARRVGLTDNLDDELFAYMMLGDERAVTATYVAGERVTI